MNATERPAGFVPDLTLVPGEQARWFVFDGPRLLLDDQEALPTGASLPFPAQDVTPLGALDGQQFFAASVTAGPPPGFSAHALRACFGRLPDTEMGLAGYAAQVIDFVRTHRFCGRCAAPLSDSGHERSRTCPACGLTVYPRVAPVAMVLIRRGEGHSTELLLARGPHFAPGVYSALAGFVEPSETLEAAAHREVQEEVGVQLTNLRYVTSQPWPFPHSLMLGFEAEYAGGTITPQPGEIEDARWFPVTALPGVPPPFSVARTLIDRAVGAALGGVASSAP
ncbi:NAD(+) diphosphatase [Deinococcus arboris]|uniref:NAD(+) diphosphatase n=1 Tax=Deinococcus arboris TaxID=2682977 RepID=UPI0034E1946D